MRLQYKYYRIRIVSLSYLVQIFWYSILSFININVCAQPAKVSFDRITNKDGLSQSTVNHIIQDKKGFLWFATFDGINKYDGYSFKVYRHDENDSNSLSHNGAVYLLEDNEGYIWVVNNGEAGLDRFDPGTEKFERFKHDPKDPGSISSDQIHHVMQDKKGDIWICTNKSLDLLIQKKEKNGVKISFKRFENKLPARYFSMAYENKFGQLLLFSSRLTLFDRTTNTFTYTNIDLEGYYALSIIEDNTGNLFVGTTENGIFRLNFNQITMSYYRQDPGKINVTPDNRNCLLMDNNKEIWIGTESYGLYKYNQEKDELINFVSDELDKTSISDNTIYSLYIDHSDILWIGTFSQGICKYDFNRKAFLHFRYIPEKENSLSGNVISSIHGINPDELWVGVDIGGGVNRLIYSGNEEPRIIHYMFDPNNTNSIGGSSVLCLVQRKNGEVWLGSAGGSVSKIIPEDPNTRQKPVIKRYNDDKWTFVIFEDSDGILWGGTWDKGLWRFNDKTEEFTHFYHNSDDSSSVCDNIIWAINEDKNKNIWIGGHGSGISILPSNEKNKLSPKFLNIKPEKKNKKGLSHKTINSFCPARDGTMWVGTGGGLNKLLNNTDSLFYIDKSKIRFESYHIKEGLPSENIVGIIEDDYGNLWMSTTNGISKFTPSTNTFVNYNESDGLQSNEFWHNAYFKNADGMLFFGGQNGFNAFYPEKIKENPFLPSVVITDLKLFNKSVKIGEKINNQLVLTKPINETDKLILSYKNNIITLEYAALHYAKPLKNKYAYFLEGFEDKWNYVENQRSVTYTNLDPGKYTFRLKASNNDNIWSDKEMALQIIITPPWWNTWLFKIFSLLLILIIIYSFFRLRLHLLKNQKKILQETVESRTMELCEANALLEERQEEISSQNEELSIHRNNLEKLINERTHQLEKAKLKAEESDRLKSAFLANMSHEIRTPMNAIIGFSNLLNENDTTKEDREKFIQMINSNGQSLMVLVDDIIDISMIESNQLLLSIETFNASNVFLELESYYHLNNEKQLSILYTNKNEKDLILNTDQVRFRQVLNNLIFNAIKYTDSGYVRFGFKKTNSEIHFFVEDSGIGISAENCEHIFDHFYKVETNSQRLYRGTGIGLAICKKLIELMGGKIWVESEVEKGSTFWFSLSGIIVSNTFQKKETKNIQYTPLQNIHFVIAEDEPANFNVLESMLKTGQKEMFWAENGKKAVDYIKSLPDTDNLIVLMDIKMPVMDGCEALHEIKKISKNIPVIAITAYALKKDIEKIKQEGFDDYLTKPIYKEVLMSTINRFTRT